ncbi:MAG: isoprenyl transferase [Alphaproteobacteria bacterium]|nr:isoprenyl transferase [Alphaproteobacteria bacterium]
METKSLTHIAFIMDGNRRWAKKRGLPIAAGHRQGAETLVEIAKAAKEMGVKYMTVYAFSTENWQREPAEVETLMNLLRHYLDTGFKELQENNARIVFIGERQMLAADILEKMAKIEADTAQNNAVTLCVALSYGGRQEITAAARELAKEVQQGTLKPEEIDMAKFASKLYTADMPEPDLMIRTSGEERISNYLLWQLAYTEFYFSPTLWPDFSKEELKKIIEEYLTRERRYGKS